MKVSELMQQMSDAGAPMEAILIAVRAIEEREEAVESKRAVERERKRRQRAKAKDEGRDSHGTVTGQSQDSPSATPLPCPPNEYISNPPIPTPENKTRARKGHRLPVDWEPKPLTDEVAAIVSAWPEGAVERELAKFRDWAAAATGDKGKKSDWDAAWRNWLRRRDEDQPRKPANDRQPRSTANAAEMARAKLRSHH